MKKANVHFLIIIILFAILSISISSCGKDYEENKIVGNWTKISVGLIPEGTSIIWTFSADHTLYRHTTISDSIITDTAQWNLNTHFASEATLTIENLDEFNNGKHIIHERNDYLKLQRVSDPSGNTGGAFLWNEFEKTN